MTRIDAQNAEVLVFTEKEGLLSPVAHDLKIRITVFALHVDEAAGRVTATLDASSLRVVCAMKGASEEPRALSDKDRREIENNIRKDVLDAAAHPEIRISAALPGGEGSVPVRVTLRGRERELVANVRVQGDRVSVEARVHQPDFGIRPYSAMFGALKVKADVRVVASWPAALWFPVSEGSRSRGLPV